jgi:hypothetical protein
MGAYVEYVRGKQPAPDVIVAPALTKTRYANHNVDGWCVSLWVTGFGPDDDSARTAWALAVRYFTAFVSVESGQHVRPR